METIAIPAMKILVGQLASPIWNELKTVWGLEDDIDKLQDLLSTINLVLGDAEKRSTSEGVVRKWLKDLKDVALDADDVLDEIQTKALQLRRKIYTPVATEVRLLFSYPNSIITRFKVAHKIQAIMKKVNEIADQISKLKLVENTTAVSHQDRETVSSIIEDEEIFGREDDKRKVIEWLIDAENEQDVAILPIVGLGGLGKTTLAQLVYNDKQITDQFQLKKWVCVGENFDVSEIVRGIVGNAKTSGSTKLEEMHKMLWEEFRDKKYILILDDVWNEDALKWERLKSLLRCSTRGNKIVVTTRSLEVARIMGTVSEPHKLEVLSDDDCWKLFEQRAFGLRKEHESPKLVEIGHEIVKKCGGLPLAAKSIGSLMATKQGEDKWLAIKNSEIWRVENSQEGIVPALLISFDHLSSQLKQCFAYCAMFPKDFRMNKLVLIQLWIAGGFVEYLQDKCLEDIGEGYFDILWSRSFFQEENRDKFGKIVSCKMHDLVHDLACSVSKDESSTLGSSWNSYRKCRHLSLSCGSTTVDLQTVANEARKLRSLFLFEDDEDEDEDETEDDEDEDEIQTSIQKDIEFAIPNLTRLRALYAAHYIGSRNALSGIGKLKHLRFLDLSYNYKLGSLPDSITNLYNLQTLLLKDCRYLADLPKGMKKMVNLRHLDLEGCCGLTTMPSGLSRLTNLQTLPLFRVGNNKEAGHLSLAELQPLKQIRGSLEISCLDNVQDPTDATKAELVTKKDIQDLSLNFIKYYNDDDDDDDDDVTVNVLENTVNVLDDDVTVNVLENLQPHPNLKTLEIWYFGGSRLPNWLGSATVLPNLVELKLTSLSRCESLPPLGQLPCLKELEIMFMDGLKKIGAELVGSLSSTGGIIGGTTFPSLKSLTLGEMRLLEEWSTIIIPKCDQGEVLFPSLETLTLLLCKKLEMLPDGLQQLTGLKQLKIYACPILEERCKRDVGEDWHKISHIPHLDIFGGVQAVKFGETLPDELQNT